MPRYSRLLVWDHSRLLVRLVAEATRSARGEGDLISQMRRASISVAANIAEGAERGSDRDFLRHLRIADGSNAETQALASIAGDAGILATEYVNRITDTTATIGRLLNGLQRRCGT
jgi:four helix bundle protein